jgi:hypothetical protein
MRELLNMRVIVNGRVLDTMRVIVNMRESDTIEILPVAKARRLGGVDCVWVEGCVGEGFCGWWGGWV